MGLSYTPFFIQNFKIMGCLITQGITSACELATAGVQKTKVWVFNIEDIDSITKAGSTISAITLASGGKAAFKIDIHRDSGIFEETLQGAANSGSSYNQSFTARILTDDDATITALDEQKHADLLFVIKKKNGNFIVIGEEIGVRPGDGTLSSTGAVAGDDAGNVVVYLGNSFENKAPFFFDTDEATTEATLDGYLTPTV